MQCVTIRKKCYLYIEEEALWAIYRVQEGNPKPGFGDEDADGDGSGREATEKDDDLLLRL